MIETITLRNYGGHVHTEIPCGRLTLLVGENASGKTSALRAVRWVSQGLDQTLPAELLRRGAAELEVVLEWEGPEGRFRIDAAYQAPNGKDDLHQARASVVNIADGSTGLRPGAVFLALNPDELIAPSRPRHLRVDDRLVELSDTVTSFQDALVFDFVDADKVPASLVSEGTLLALGMLTAVETLGGRDRGIEVLLVDDIDRALHPRAQRALVDRLRAILAARPNLQILATSHSPYLVDAARPEEVVLLGRNAQGLIVAKRLDTFPDERLRHIEDVVRVAGG